MPDLPTLPRRILLVEDDLLDLDLMLQALATNGLLDEIDVVRDGGEALAYLLRQDGYEQRRSGNPVMVLLDLGLPKIGGLDLLQIIRETPQLADIAVVVVTSSNDSEHILRCYRLGVDGYIQKPAEFKQFVKAMAQIRLFWALLQPSASAPDAAGMLSPFQSVLPA